MTIRRTICSTCSKPFTRDDRKPYCLDCEKKWAEYYAKWTKGEKAPIEDKK